jgi:hypothetical protein
MRRAALANSPRTIQLSDRRVSVEKDQLVEQTQRLADVEEAFVTVARTMVDASTGLFDVLTSFREYLEGYHDAFRKTEELMVEQIATLRELSDTMRLLIKTSAENNISIVENSQRMQELLRKVEGYFGTSAGLEYDN